MGDSYNHFSGALILEHEATIEALGTVASWQGSSHRSSGTQAYESSRRFNGKV
jgi:hypothetical protein